MSIASHDDDSEDKLAFMDGLEATISEFPISLDIARAARRAACTPPRARRRVLVTATRAPQRARGVQAGAIDVLCSDYYPAALLDAVFTLRDQCGLDIAKAFALVTINPAKAAGIADEVGSIAVGKRADVLLVREISCGEGSGEHPVAGPDSRVARTMPWSRARSWAAARCFARTIPTSRAAMDATPSSSSRSTSCPALWPRRCSMALLRIDGLSKTFLLHRVNRRVQGCQDIDFAIEPGQFVGITGRSGSGKSTILRCIWRTNLPERGRILYDSQRFGMLDLAQATQRQMLYLRTYELGYVSRSSTPCRAKPPTTSC